jgi:hypothetical protein
MLLVKVPAHPDMLVTVGAPPPESTKSDVWMLLQRMGSEKFTVNELLPQFCTTLVTLGRLLSKIEAVPEKVMV